MKIKKCFLGILLSLSLMLGMMPGMSMTALAMEAPVSTYTITIPSTLTVTNSGYNPTSGISVKAEIPADCYGGLTVEASSSDEFALVSGENKINYQLMGEPNPSYDGRTHTYSWQFYKDFDKIDTTASMVIFVEDYSEKPAGTYHDSVTFTARLIERA